MDAEQARTIGQRVKRIRNARKKTLVVIAGLAGISKSKLDRIERGEAALDKLSDIVAVANALEVSPGDLVRLPIPAPANGHTDSTLEAVGQALDAIDAEQPDGVALDGRPGDTVAPMDVVAELAERYGATGMVDSRGFYYTPVDVTISRTFLALEADEPDQAVNIARQVDPQSHPFPLNQSGYWILAGRALSKLPGRGDDAVRALRTAERLFPTRVLRHQGVREVLGEMLTSRSVRTMGLELRGMAYRAGLLSEEHRSD